MFNYVLFSFLTTLLFLISFVVYDLRYREIPNYLVFLFFGIGVVFQLVISLFIWNFSFIFNSLISIAITFVVCFIFWELGLFAGGDLKVFVSISALNPINLNFFGSTLSFSVISTPIFGISLIIASILCTLPYLLLFTIYYIISKNYFYLIYRNYVSKFTFISVINSIIIIFLINSFTNIFSLNTPIVLILLLSFVLILLFSNILKYNKVAFYSSMVLLYGALLAHVFISRSTFSLIFKSSDLASIILSVLFIYLLIIIYKVIKERILVNEINVSELKEGIVTYYDYYKVNNEIIEKKSTFLSLIKENIYKNENTIKIIDSRRAGGLTRKEVTFLNDSYKNKLIAKTIKTKVTLAFTPSVLLGYVLLNIFGDIIWAIF